MTIKKLNNDLQSNALELSPSLNEGRAIDSGSATRRPYQAPELMRYGDVRDITMGPTVGFGESGGGPFCAEGVNCP